jgi:hypothetical protein
MPPRRSKRKSVADSEEPAPAPEPVSKRAKAVPERGAEAKKGQAGEFFISGADAQRAQAVIYSLTETLLRAPKSLQRPAHAHPQASGSHSLLLSTILEVVFARKHCWTKRISPVHMKLTAPAQLSC